MSHSLFPSLSLDSSAPKPLPKFSLRMAFTGRLQELMKKYGKVALGVHFSVSAAAITGFYVAIKNNVDVDVESIFEKVGLSPRVPDNDRASGVVILDGHDSLSPKPPREQQQQMEMTRTAELAASSGEP
ncbi:hypothetical protein C4D60_Mb03t00510 [Musa balbisiana]|uniref:DUF1279 domain-containing protein n=1 Tax=Musa balbisiana TaxID=52838 RepID=A0A4S8J6J0_MUSBA|nr:hypothetical protein C4D60_Mb03t00510 [Musa balbisiana]